MSKVDLGRLLEDSGAVLRGHFILTSGRHSDVYFEKFRVLERPDVLSALCAEIVGRFGEGSEQEPSSDIRYSSIDGTKGRRDEGTPDLQSKIQNPISNIPNPQSEVPFGLVAGPTTGGIIIAFEVARQMGLPAVYIESEERVRKLRRGARIEPGARVLVVDDVLTTGKSVFETMEVVRAAGGAVAGVAVLIDRTETPIDFGCPFFASYRVQARSFPPNGVPDWLAAIPPTKPGTGTA